MSGAKPWWWVRFVGRLILVWLMLAGCGGSHQSSEGTDGGVSRLSLRLVPTTQPRTGGPRQVVGPTTINSIRITVSAPELRTPVIVTCVITEPDTEQCRATEAADAIELTVTLQLPRGITVQVVVTAFDAQARPLLQGEKTLLLSQGTQAESIDLIPVQPGAEMPPGAANRLPRAEAGHDQAATVGRSVILRGNASSDVDGDALSFAWSLTTKPDNSATTLSDPLDIQPALVVDQAGTYVAQLIVNDGRQDGPPDQVMVSTDNVPPVAHAGPDQVVTVGATVQLDSSQASDVNGHLLTFAWALATLPAGSTATLSSPVAVMPTFVADQPGAYVVQLTVSDGLSPMAPPAFVTISTQNVAPVADAGPDQAVVTGATVQLDGRNSRAADNAPLTFRWSFTFAPAGSLATLSDATAGNPTFVADRPGTYVAQLIVNDGRLDSPPTTVTLSTRNVAPVAVAANLTSSVTIGSPVGLDGSVSHDANNDPLTFAWALITLPPGSRAILTNATTAAPTFVPDFAGTYVAQLVVNDGQVSSVPDTVAISVPGFLSLPQQLNVSLLQPTALPITMAPNRAPPGGVVVNVTSSDSSIVRVLTPTVLIPEGRFAANGMLQGVVNGTAVITATSRQALGATSQVTSGTAVNIVQSSVGLNRSFGNTFTIQLQSPDSIVAAPSAGVPVTLTAQDPGCVTIPASVIIPAGRVSSVVPITAGGTAAFPCTTTVMVSAPGLGQDTIQVRVDPQPTMRLFGVPVVVGAGLQTDGGGLGLNASNHGGVTVRLEMSDDSVARVAPDSQTPGGRSLDRFVPPGETFVPFVVQGVEGRSGTVVLTATAPGFTPIQGAVQVVQPALQLVGLPGSLPLYSTDEFFRVQVGVPDINGLFVQEPQAVRAGGTALTATITNTNPPPPPPMVAALFEQATAMERQTVQVTINVGEAESPFDAVAFRALGVGRATVAATIPNLLATVAATQGVDVLPPRIFLDNLPSQVGYGLQTDRVTVRLEAPNHPDAMVAVTSNNPPAILLSLDGQSVGGANLTLPVPRGATEATFVVQGIGPGAATITAQAQDFVNDSGMISVVQPGLQLRGLPANLTAFAPDVPFQVQIGVPDVSNTIVELVQAVRAGGTPVTPTLSSSNAGVGRLQTQAGPPFTVQIGVGQSSSPSSVPAGGAAFDALAVGTTDVSATIPNVIATTAATESVAVGTPGITVGTGQLTVGGGLQTDVFLQLGEANHGGVTVHVESSHPNVALLAPDSQMGGTQTIDLAVPNGNRSARLTVHGLAPGSATLTATAPGFVNGTATVTVVPAGLQLALLCQTTSLGQDCPLQVQVGVPDAAQSRLQQLQVVRAGSSALTATITNRVAAVGQLVTQAMQGQAVSVQIPPGQFASPPQLQSGGAGFDAFTAGMTTLSTTIPGMIATTAATTQVTVGTPGIQLFTQIMVGAGLQTTALSASLGASNHGGVMVHLESSDPTVALVAPNAQTPGTASLDLPLADGQRFIAFVVQGVEGAAGSVTVTATAPGFISRSGVVTVVQPAFALRGLPNVVAPANRVPFTVIVGIPDVNGNDVNTPQAVRAGGATLTATVRSSNPGVAGVETAQSGGPQPTVTVPIPVGQSQSPANPQSGGVTFNALSGGTTTVEAVISGVLPTRRTTQQVAVTLN